MHSTVTDTFADTHTKAQVFTLASRWKYSWWYSSSHTGKNSSKKEKNPLGNADFTIWPPAEQEKKKTGELVVPSRRQWVDSVWAVGS
jgi:hypothetical protein